MKDLTNELPRSPRAKFSCPVSPLILWNHGLIYSSCPICPEQRDMGACDNCPLKGQMKQRQKVKQKKTIEVERRKKEPIPKIDKTYNSD